MGIFTKKHKTSEELAKQYDWAMLACKFICEHIDFIMEQESRGYPPEHKIELGLCSANTEYVQGECYDSSSPINAAYRGNNLYLCVPFDLQQSDADIAQEITQELQQAGFSVYTDEWDLANGCFFALRSPWSVGDVVSGKGWRSTIEW